MVLPTLEPQQCHQFPSYELCWADAGSRELTPRIGQSCEYHSFHNFRDKIAKKILWLFQEMSNTCLNLQRKSEDCFRKCLHVYIKCLTLNISRVHWCERGGQETVSGTPTRKVWQNLHGKKLIIGQNCQYWQSKTD